MAVGADTRKFAPLAEVPSEDPPEATVYQSMVLPAEVALKGVFPSEVQTTTGLFGVTPVGGAGVAFTVKVALFETSPHPEPFSITL